MTHDSTVRRVLVTGSASGIGRAVALAFLEQGSEVIGWDLEAGAVSEYPVHRVDMRDPDAVHRAAAGLKRLDVLVNCASIARRGRAETLSVEDWQAVNDTHLNDTFYACQAAFPALRASGDGLIINVGSFVAHRAGPGRASYAASKADVIAMTQVLALDFAESGIRALSVSPGYTRIDRGEGALQAARFDEQRLLSRIPARRLAQPNEIGRAVRALADPAFQYANGSDFVIDGGILANGVDQ